MTDRFVELQEVSRRMDLLSLKMGDIKGDMRCVIEMMLGLEGTLFNLMNAIRATHSDRDGLASRVSRLENIATSDYPTEWTVNGGKCDGA